MRRPIAATMLFLALGGRARAEPEAARVAVEWVSEEGCLDAAGLAAEVSPLLRRHRLAERGAADAIVRGQAVRAPDRGWRAELTVLDEDERELGTRELVIDESGCAALREHVVLITAMLVDSRVIAESARAASEPAPAPEPEPPPEGPPARQSRSEERPAALTKAPVRPVRRSEATPWRLDLFVGAAIEAGRLPESPLGGQVIVGAISPGGFRLEVYGAAFASARARAEGGESRFSWRSLGGLGCAPSWRIGRAGAAFCLGLEAGAIRAQGRGFLVNRSQQELLFDLLGELRAELALSRAIYLRAAGSGRAMLWRPRFGYRDGAGEFRVLYAPSIAGITARVGVGLRFP